MKFARQQINAGGLPPWEVLPFFVHHATLFSLLLAAALCDWDHRSIPLTLTVTGTLIGLVFATCCPWPWPNDPATVANLNQPFINAAGNVQQKNWAFNLKDGELTHGLYPWPVWGPVPDWLWNHRWALGLVTGLTGAAVGMAMIRAVKFTVERGLGKEALGLGDADVMMMAGAFLGWQVVAVAFWSARSCRCRSVSCSEWSRRNMHSHSDRVWAWNSHYDDVLAHGSVRLCGCICSKKS